MQSKGKAIATNTSTQRISCLDWFRVQLTQRSTHVLKHLRIELSVLVAGEEGQQSSLGAWALDLPTPFDSADPPLAKNYSTRSLCKGQCVLLAD